MGGGQSSTINQDVLNSVRQNATTTCKVDPTQKIDGNVVIREGGSGNIKFTNSTNLSGVDCNLSASLNSQVTNELSAMLQQQMTSVTGLIPDFTVKKQTMAIGQTIKSQIAQSSFAACQIGFQQEQDSNYIFAYNFTGDTMLTNDGSVNNASCTITNAIKQVIKNNLEATGKQTMTTISGLVLAVIAIAVIALVFFMIKSKSSVKSAGAKAGSFNGMKVLLK